jgi:hypothetical protein
MIQVYKLVDYVGHYELVKFKIYKKIYPGQVIKFKYQDKTVQAEVLEVGKTILVRESGRLKGGKRARSVK